MRDDLFGWIRGMDRNESNLLCSWPADDSPDENLAWLANRQPPCALGAVMAGRHQAAR